MREGSSFPVRVSKRIIVVSSLISLFALETYRTVLPRVQLTSVEKRSSTATATSNGSVTYDTSDAPTPAPKQQLGLTPQGVQFLSIPSSPTKIPQVKIPPALQQAIDQNIPDRHIVLVHVGKAGGMALRKVIAAQCYDYFPADKLQRDQCLHRFNHHASPLARMTRTTIHMQDTQRQVVNKQATTFLFVLRNPIDRVVSSYRYNHPANCQRNVYRQGKPVPLNYGCTLIDQGRMKPGTDEYQLWKDCFPSPQMEAFAQAAWPPSKTNKCHTWARQTLRGQGGRLNLHMAYNYQYYFQCTLIGKAPQTEILAIRVEHAQQDWVQLNVALGGSGGAGEYSPYSHGSELYAPSPLSQQALHKMCCVLEKEIEVYLELYDRALNLDEQDLNEAETQLREQCGLTPTQSWNDYWAQCQGQVIS